MVSKILVGKDCDGNITREKERLRRYYCLTCKQFFLSWGFKGDDKKYLIECPNCRCEATKEVLREIPVGR
jgi:DNA-directed RNA polymerase subunit RPC12/RpoP